MGKIEIFKGINEQFYFRIIADNGEIVATSEGYVSKQGCKDGIKAVKNVMDTRDVRGPNIVDITKE
jgi:uncharacterized protein YegP (UPF0339 family)